MNTLGTAQSVLIKEVSLFQRFVLYTSLCTCTVVVGTTGSVMIREVSNLVSRPSQLFNVSHRKAGETLKNWEGLGTRLRSVLILEVLNREVPL